MPAYRSVRRYNRVPRGGGAVRNLARGMGYAWRNRRAIVKAGRAVGKGLRNYFGSNTTTTAQRDIRTSKAPRTKRPNRRFTRRVENVISQHSGKNTVLFNGPNVSTNSSAGTQNWRMFSLFGSNGSLGMHSDINKMLGFHEDVTDLEDPESKNLYYHYGVLEIGFTSRTTNTDRVIIDIYEYKVRKNTSTFNTPDSLVLSNISDEDLLTETLPAAQVTLNNVGATPYQLPDVCKNLKFGKRTTIQLAPGGTSTFTMARKKNKWISGLKVRDNTGFAFGGWTEGLLVIQRGAPGNGTTAANVNVDYMFNRKYCWRAMDPDAKNEYRQEGW